MNNFNISVIGHVSHGKSTLIGRIAYNLKQVDKELEKKAKKYLEQDKLSKTNFFSALLARTIEEKEQGRTYFPSHIRIRTENDLITLIDTPGHEAYKKGRAYGLFLGDAALLVVSAVDGLEKISIEGINFIKALNLPLLGVVITKIDLNVSENKLNMLEEEIFNFLDKVNITYYNHEKTKIFKVSALKNINMDELINYLLNIGYSSKYIEGPLRFCVQGKQEIFQVPGVGSIVSGIIESGEMKINDTLLLEPISTIKNKLITLRVKDMELSRGRNEPKGLKIKSGKPRDLVSIKVDKKYRELKKYLGSGGILTHKDGKIKTTKKIIAEITVINKPSGVYIGWAPSVLFHVMSTNGRIIKILRYKKDIEGNWDDFNKSFIKEGEQAEVIIEFEKPIPIEEIIMIPRLSKFTLRDYNIISAIGYCKEILT